MSLKVNISAGSERTETSNHGLETADSRDHEEINSLIQAA